ncbi:MAG: alpha/beta fold hydrolase [Acidimicrobiales bacterium]
MDGLRIEAQGFEFTGLCSGPADGRPVLLLHGFPQTSWSWHHQLDALGQAGYHAVAIDQRGYSSGARPAETAAYHIDFLVSDVLALADVLGMDKFDLVGHDWGGMVAWVTGARHPQRLRTLTVVSTPHPGAFAAAIANSEGEQQQRSSYISVFRQEGVAESALLGDDGSGDGLRAMFAASGIATDDVSEFVDAMTKPGALTAALNWYRATEIDSMNDVGQVGVPTMYVWSTDDIALGREAAESTGAFVSAPYRFEVLDGVSHWVPETAPDRLNALLLDFLRSN